MSSLLRLDDLKDVNCPLRFVEIEPLQQHVVAVAFMTRRRHPVAQDELPILQPVERQLHPTLAAGRAVIDDDQIAPLAAVPEKRDESVPGRIAVPGRPTVEQLPAAVAE